ncbi:MAG TPA: hypothetical protein VN025_17290 [Candidatus Dormibacteraeota bacterium]|jgi:hypothetical protein|nr:hypothetical protein [Candidatus Dormibacteraeota bacterium]
MKLRIPLDKLFVLFLIVLASSLALAQTPPLPPVQRQVQNQTIISNELPAADLTFAKEFRFVGAQVVNLYGNAIAEQHLFVEPDANGAVKRFYWVQFEHFLPTNQYTYDYKLPGTTDIGGLPFIYDVKAFLNYQAEDLSDPRSDSAALASLMAQHHLAFPKNAARVRMFHLPTPDLRTELMIIYGEALLPDSKIPATPGGLLLSEASPESAKLLLDHAKQSLTIRKH